MAYQEWAHSLFACISESQQDSLASQKDLTSLLNMLCSSIPGYIRYWLCKLDDHNAAWQGQIEATLLKYQQDFESLAGKLNQFREHIDAHVTNDKCENWGEG
ncbi:hypothetical protein DSO57_1001789 [Entomophthora muscae]|uniref:Uncharacterized protein n=1 Tax=Entomophthora muscae TaxID=34485 RepID=A0ACC2U7B2_9FUNG|nr:hypothetical protein DSO57_1001789 [Entomophthora muscae]